MKIDKPDRQWWRAIDESVGSLLDSRHWQFRSFPKETSLWPTRYLKKKSKLVSSMPNDAQLPKPVWKLMSLGHLHHTFILV